MSNVDINVTVGANKGTSDYKTIVLKSNHSFAQQVTLPNVKYVVKYNYDLDGANFTMPYDCILEFDGGVITNGTINCRNTRLTGNLDKSIDNIAVFSGTYEDYTNDNLYDKKYAIEAYSGLGRKILGKNIVNGKNVLTQAMLADENTIYIIRYDYDLNGASITIPNNSVLKFEGGSINNGGIVGDNTRISAHNVAIFKEIEISGTWIVPKIYSSWIYDVTAENNIFNLSALCNDEIHNTIYIEDKNAPYIINPVETIANTKWDGWILTGKNITIEIDGELQVKTNSFPNYSAITLTDAQNIHICGNGTINGDRLTHIGEHERGHCIIIGGCTDVLITGIEIKNAVGDGIYIYNEGLYDNKGNITIRNIVISKCRRNGIATITIPSNLVIENIRSTYIGVEVDGIQGVSGAGYAIDIEPNNNVPNSINIKVDNIYVDNCVAGVGISNQTNVIAFNSNVSNIYCTNVTSVGCSINRVQRGIANFLNITTDDTPLRSFVCRNSTGKVINLNTPKSVGLEGSSAELYIYDSNISGSVNAGNDAYKLHIFNSYITSDISARMCLHMENTIVQGTVVLYTNSKIKGCSMTQVLNELNNVEVSCTIQDSSFSRIIFKKLTNAVIENCIISGDITDVYRVYLESVTNCRFRNCLINTPSTSTERYILGLSTAVGVFDFKNNIIISEGTKSLFSGGWQPEMKTDNYYNGVNLTNLDAITSRPTLGSVNAGTMAFDKNLSPKRPIWWNGSAWVDATGATV